jgi:hypothetical protein
LIEPWKTQPTAASTPAQKATGLPTILLASVAFFLGSYFPWQPIDFSKFDSDKQSEVVKLEKGSWVLIVEETADRSKFPWLATVIADADFWDGLASQGINWRLYDDDAPEAAAYTPDALAAGLPALLVVSPAGRVRIAKSCPPTTAAIAELLGGIR